MRWRLFACEALVALVTCSLLVGSPAPARAIARCDVTAAEPRRLSPTDSDAHVEAHLTCDRAVLTERFTNAVCLQIKKGKRFVDHECCKVINTRVSTRPWLMCGEAWPLRAGTHQYRTRARANRLSTGTREVDYSPAVTIAL